MDNSNDRTRYMEANRKAWNVAMSYHRKAKDEEWDKLLADGSFLFQTEPELSILKKTGIEGRSIVHVCCNNGRELLTLKRMGAGRCAGFDISDEAIADARGRSEKFHIPAEYYRYSVYDIPESFHNNFDLVYITIGTLVWLPDLIDFFAVAKKVLKREGVLFIYEQHPLTQMLPWDVGEECEKPLIENNYFYDKHQVYNDSLDYYGNVTYRSPDTYEFLHTLSDIFNAIIKNQFRITLFQEYDHDISNGFAWIKKTGLRLPLSYILTSKLDDR